MRRLLVAAALLLAPTARAAAQDTPVPPPPAAAPAPPPKPRTTEQAADAVAAAVAAKDEAAVDALAAQDDPDPWLVADELLFRGRADEAEAFARASRRRDAEKLPAYVAAARAKPSDVAARAALTATNDALLAGRPADALAAADGAKPAGGDVVSVRLEFGRGLALERLARVADCTAALSRAADAAGRLGWTRRQAAALDRVGDAFESVGDLAKARSAYERALAIEEELGDRAGVSQTLFDLGEANRLRGEYTRAAEQCERSLAIAQELGDADLAWRVLGSLGAISCDVGDNARGRRLFEQSLALAESLHDDVGVANAVHNLGTVCRHLGDHARAREYLERALAMHEAIGNPGDVARSLLNLGLCCDDLAEYTKAREYYERALAIWEPLGDRDGVSACLNNLAVVYGRLGDRAKAKEFGERAFALLERIGDRAGMAASLHAMGEECEREGDPAKARELYEKSLAIREEIGDATGTAGVLWALGALRLAQGEPREALVFARRAVDLPARLTAGLAEEEGAWARGMHERVYSLGARAAARLALPADAALFLESGRAGALTESLGSREALRNATIPRALRDEEAGARAAESDAAARLRAARGSGDRAAIAACAADAAAARKRCADAVERIQRETKAGRVVYPKADPLGTIQARLREGDALVLYGLFDEEALALVATAKAARIVPLGKTGGIESHCASLDAGRSDADPTAAVAALRRVVIDPLALDASTTRLLVSPDGALSYVPFALLAPEKEIVHVPSGTTYGLLLDDEAKRGEGVLAIGDPDYDVKSDAAAGAVAMRGGMNLVRLPATGVEAKAVGTFTLLGRDATEAGLRDALAKKPRWRAVHLACHGLVDPERPMFSSLALTPSGDDDGFLTALEAFRLECPADLVVLSACETGKGRVYRAEGIVGLTRAFMLAGAPRVLVSLWKVDDEATRALMTRFYGLWNPKDGRGVAAAAALRQAQEFVRSHEKWKHPRFWAAWVLWGLG